MFLGSHDKSGVVQSLMKITALRLGYWVISALSCWAVTGICFGQGTPLKEGDVVTGQCQGHESEDRDLESGRRRPSQQITGASGYLYYSARPSDPPSTHYLGYRVRFSISGK